MVYDFERILKVSIAVLFEDLLSVHLSNLEIVFEKTTKSCKLL
jgi:hypothetical protein